MLDILVATPSPFLIVDGRGDTVIEAVALSLATKPDTSPPTLLDLVRVILEDTTFAEGTAGLLFTLPVLVVVAAVSYTHLTLPTKRIVEISEVAVSLKKKIEEDKDRTE
eukprot:TRINITY_DN30793_c0_g1_i3.p1 TRINITY_DN30793_c0_g1~~TRINITY_DN30793_c0_g1_i3.p1  ORF type:complete len:109 (+),score=9.26 TRINITY_DN30793_c0_g1_i3:137-463(+)